jgi:hypothetical protein
MSPMMLPLMTFNFDTHRTEQLLASVGLALLSLLVRISSS